MQPGDCIAKGASQSIHMAGLQQEFLDLFRLGLKNICYQVIQDWPVTAGEISKILLDIGLLFQVLESEHNQVQACDPTFCPLGRPSCWSRWEQPQCC